jgi:hypothetical protein
MWPFGVVSRRIGYVLSCGTCSTSEAISDEEGKGRQARELRIPFLRRYGLGLVVGIPAAWGLFLAVREVVELME